MVTQAQIDAFHKDGFLNYGALLTPEETRELREALQRVLDGSSEAKPESTTNLSGGSEEVVVQVVNVWEAEPAFRRHLFHPKLVAIVAALMGTDTVRVWHDQAQIKPPRIGGPTVWHQDYPYWPVIAPADLVSAWVALEDADPDNGCMSMVPRSHRWGIYGRGTVGNTEEHAPAYDPEFPPEGEEVEVVPCPVRAGSVMFHHCLTWHGAPPNRSDRNRPAIAVHYMPGHTRYEPSGEHLIGHHIEVAPGEILKGRAFPTVMEGETVLEG
ncbi:MAG: phytanoyl-CoA dioxygenase family protein [Fimbriimonadaceae bacterium]|nr:phytanoyl-CoA dioxygenase family protein [Chthonomonadaceae bacterium]MCO5297105.1 phytanoyl-CoA dioxygenase family protein [Fimbriimonadaceae bacterium]